jgi:glycosyltransferase involved in cell wall biosynthesis
MRIAQVPPLYEAVPPRLYGGTERVVAHLTDALVQLGHEVTLFASAEARTLGQLAPVRDQAIRLDPAPLKSDLAAHLHQLAEVRRRADEFDVIHFHTDMIQFPMFEGLAAKTVTTLHGRLDLKDLAEVYRMWPQFPLVSISDDQRRPLPDANWAATVHHGMSTDLYRFTPRGQGYLAFLGRISPEKRPDRAIGIAIRAGRRRRGGRASPPRWTTPTAPISRTPSSPCCTIRSWSSPARSATRRSRRSWAGPTRCCSPSTGPSRSGW